VGGLAPALRGGATSVLPAALCGAVLAALLGCTDRGVIGKPAALECEPACAADQRCDRALGMCIACGDDCETPVDAGRDACEGSDDEPCDADAAVCAEGGCSECEDDDDCDGEGSRECQDGRCVETGDDEEADDEEEGDGLPDAS
jgi:hypothetical protein